MKRAILIAGLTLIAGVTVLLAASPARNSAAGPPASVSFAKAITFASPVLYPSSLAAGDLNHDGVPDLAVISPENTTPLEYALGKGNGHFHARKQNNFVGYAPSFVLLADVDGDRNLDAITTDVSGDGVYLTFGDGRGHLYGGRQLLVGGVNSTYIVAVADLNGDGIPDIVGTTNDGIFAILGKGSRKFATALTFGSGGRQPYGIAVGDLNHDGIPDIVVANNGADQAPYDYNIAVLLGKGNGTFDAPVRYHAGARPWQLVLGDFNGDGNLDTAVVGGTERVQVLLGNGDGSFSAPKSYQAGIAPHAIAVADVNGDGKLDLVVASSNVSVLLGNGDGTFQLPIQLPSHGHHPTQLIVADFNRDGKPDVGTINGDSTISIFLNTTPFPAPQSH